MHISKIRKVMVFFFICLFTSLSITFLWYIANYGQHVMNLNPYTWVNSIKIYPWTDMIENCVIGFNLANNQAFEHDTVVTHMPGIYQYLALFYRLFHLQTYTPSYNLIPILISTSMFAVIIFDFICMAISLLVLGFKKIETYLFTAFWILILTFYQSATLPTSENLLPFVLMLQVTFLYKIIDNSQPVSQRLILASWSISFLPLINLLIGLTMAPGVVFLWLVIAVLICRMIPLMQRLSFSQILSIGLPLALSLIVLSYESCLLDLHALWFWNIVVNKGNLPSSPFYLNILHSLLHLHVPIIIGSALWELVLSMAFYLITRKLCHSLKRIDITFVFCSLMLALLGTWRNEAKCGPTAGISWFFICCALFQLQPFFGGIRRFMRYKMLLSILWAGVIFATCYEVTVLIKVWPLITRELSNPPARNLAFDKANVCRYRSTEACRCLQVTVFGPQIFLEQDIRQCKDRFSSFAYIIFLNNEVRQRLNHDLDDTKVAFLSIFPYQPSNIDIIADKSDPIIQKLFFGRLRCEAYDSKMKLCYRDEEY